MAHEGIVVSWRFELILFVNSNSAIPRVVDAQHSHSCTSLLISTRSSRGTSLMLPSAVVRPSPVIVYRTLFARPRQKYEGARYTAKEALSVVIEGRRGTGKLAFLASEYTLIIHRKNNFCLVHDSPLRRAHFRVHSSSPKPSHIFGTIKTGLCYAWCSGPPRNWPRRVWTLS